MDLSGLFGSYPGLYVVQSFFHLTVSAIIVSVAIRVWDVKNPRITQRFRFLAIIFPIFSFPLYQLINPERGSIFFRESALFDSSRWLSLALFGKVPVGLLFIALLLLTTIFFFLQELIPVVRHSLASRGGETKDVDFVDNTAVNGLLADLPGEKPEVLVMDDDDDCVVFSTTGRRAAVYLSSGLLRSLDPEEVRAAVAHEIAHIKRSKVPVLFIVFLLRVLLFFNPVVLIEFRRAAQEEEKICDDMAVALTGKPRALAETLKKLCSATEDRRPETGKLSDFRESVEERSHAMHIESRIKRLEDGNTNGTNGEWLRFTMVFAAIIVVNYYIV